MSASSVPGKAGKAGRPPADIVCDWLGIDRESIPELPKAVNTGWLQTLLDNSNLNFTGAYVSGDPLPGYRPGLFTPPSRAIRRGWIPNVQALNDQGWGIVFFYVGYSVGGQGVQRPVGQTDRQRGALHARQLRTTLQSLGPAWEGAVVFIDNEDGECTALPADLADYYSGLFDEMSRPDPTLACFRPGMYGH